MNHSSCLPCVFRIFKCLASGIGKAASTVICIASAPCLLAQGPVLELQKSVDGMATWQKVPITSGMLMPEGRLLMSDEPGPVFYRMKIEVAPPAQLGDMVYIHSGAFQMGDTFNEGSTSERPVHSVTVSGFYLQNTEVTKAQWDAVANWAAANGYDIDAAGGSGKAANHPVQEVTWHEVVKYCNARSQMEGLIPCYTVGGATYKTGTSTPDCNWSAGGYRLPTEAEWEKAARGGLSGKRYPWGDTITHSQANYDSSPLYKHDVSPTRGFHPAYNDGVVPYSAPVGSFAPNGYGLYDMAGNLLEWCWDWYDSSYYSTSPGTDPRGPASSVIRVSRGGAWNGNSYDCRSSYRDYGGPTGYSPGVGFRPARSSVP